MRPMLPEKQGVKPGCKKYYGTTKYHKKRGSLIIKRLAISREPKTIDYDNGLLKMG
jgi:hypothetical protein